MSGPPRTLFRKIWDAHVVADLGDGMSLLYIDRHLVNEVTSPQAFAGLRNAGRRVRRPEHTIAVADHNVPTSDRAAGIAEAASRVQVETLERNVTEFDVPYVPLLSKRQGIVHVICPELGLTLPGMTIVCGDSHTSTHGAFGALAFGIGTSEVEHVLATQTLPQQPARSMLVRLDGALGSGVTAKDLILGVIGRIGTAGATGHVIEYAGDLIRTLDMAARMTICNMSIEAGARAGLIGPDDVTFDYLAGCRYAPKGTNFERAVEGWRTLCTDRGARFDRTAEIDVSRIAPMVTWGTSPQAVVEIDDIVPDPASLADPTARADAEQMLRYMDLRPGQALRGLAIDVAFIAGRRVATGVRALIVPGSGMVKAAAEAEGLSQLFVDAGFEWREPGCSMCLGMNPDKLAPGERCASSSNRNFEGRQGAGGRTHLMSPGMVAAAAVEGCIADVREYAG